MKLSCNPRAFLLLRVDQPPTHVGKSVFRLFAFSNIGEDRKSAGLTLEINQFRGTERGPNLTVSPANLNLQIPNISLLQKLFHKRNSLVGIYP